MRLQLQGVHQTGVSLLDTGITDIEVAVINGIVHLYASTGRNGGLSEYVVGADGQVSLHTTVIYPANITATVSDRLVIADDGSGPVVLVGDRASGLIAYAIRADGGLGAQSTLIWDYVDRAIDAGSMGHLDALITLSGNTIALLPDDFDAGAVVELICVSVGGRDYMLTADDTANGVSAYRIDPSTGEMVKTATMGAYRGLGVDAPSAMEVVTIGGRTYVLLAAANTNSLSVMELTANGRLIPTDHVVDNGHTRFEGVQAMDVIQAGDHTFVVAGGADNGSTVFELLPDGSLVQIATLGDGADTAMHKVTAISLAVAGNLLHIYVGSQNEAGITEFTVDLTTLGDLIEGTDTAEVLTGTAQDDILLARGQGDSLRGGAGDDILVSGASGTQMTGGAGADIYVIREGSGATTITDFQRGIDHLDLSDLPMLRDPSQLTFTTTSTGCVIEYRGQVIVITSANGQPLRLVDVFPDGFEWADHFPYIPPEDEAPPNPGLSLLGGAGRDTLVGTAADDTLVGGAGKDTLVGGAGNDLLDGGDGKDSLTAASGDNIMLGGTGRDTIVGGWGNDWIEGGIGKDIIVAGGGDDTIYGGLGRDNIKAGAGNDLVYGDGGRNRIALGEGNDTAYGGTEKDIIEGEGGDDLVYAGDGDDLAYGGAGSDTLHGEGGNDVLGGDAGGDVLDGGLGNDSLWGGDGNDTLLGGDGADLIEAGEGDDYADAGSGNDRVYGRNGDDSLDGGAGNDAIWGDNGNDTVLGGWGDDWLNGGTGNDILNGGPGNDTLRGGPGDDVFWGGAGADVFEFFRDHDTGRIMDFNPDEGDIIRLDDWIWFSLGDLTAEEVVDRFGSVDANGNVVLDFTDVGGNVVILDGYHDLDALPDHIEII